MHLSYCVCICYWFCVNRRKWNTIWCIAFIHSHVQFSCTVVIARRSRRRRRHRHNLHSDCARQPMGYCSFWCLSQATLVVISRSHRVPISDRKVDGCYQRGQMGMLCFVWMFVMRILAFVVMLNNLISCVKQCLQVFTAIPSFLISLPFISCRTGEALRCGWYRKAFQRNSKRYFECKIIEQFNWMFSVGFLRRIWQWQWRDAIQLLQHRCGGWFARSNPPRVVVHLNDYRTKCRNNQRE